MLEQRHRLGVLVWIDVLFHVEALDGLPGDILYQRGVVGAEIDELVEQFVVRLEDDRQVGCVAACLGGETLGGNQQALSCRLFPLESGHAGMKRIDVVNSRGLLVILAFHYVVGFLQARLTMRQHVRLPTRGDGVRFHLHVHEAQHFGDLVLEFAAALVAGIGGAFEARRGRRHLAGGDFEKLVGEAAEFQGGLGIGLTCRVDLFLQEQRAPERNLEIRLESFLAQLLAPLLHELRIFFCGH